VSALLRTLIFTLVAPCTLVVWVPWRWLLPRSSRPDLSGWGLLSALVFLFGGAIYLWCAFWAFAGVGGGTPAPIDPPRRLVVHGLYRYVRNPMYWGVLLMLAGESLSFRSRLLLEYSLAVAVGFMLFVLLYEEPALRRKFGAAHDEYRRSVPRWMPRWPHKDLHDAL
jgi:protein-S-isoprenylcysteine O-methyltransferase Ste14